PQRGLDLVLVGHRVIADEPLGLEDPGDLHLQFGRGKLHPVVVRLDPVADPGQHIGYWVCHRHSVIPLPARYGDARDVAAERELPKTNAAELRLAQEAARAAAAL